MCYVYVRVGACVHVDVDVYGVCAIVSVYMCVWVLCVCSISYLQGTPSLSLSHTRAHMHTQTAPALFPSSLERPSKRQRVGNEDKRESVSVGRREGREGASSGGVCSVGEVKGEERRERPFLGICLSSRRNLCVHPHVSRFDNRDRVGVYVYRCVCICVYMSSYVFAYQTLHVWRYACMYVF